MASPRVQFWVAFGIWAVVYGVPNAVIAADVWLVRSYGDDASISRVALAAQQRHPTLVITVPFVVGVAVATIVTHLFLYQQIR